MKSDPLGDLLGRIRRGALAKKPIVEVAFSYMNSEIIKSLTDEGFLDGFEISDETKFPSIRIRLRYDSEKKPAFHRILKVSSGVKPKLISSPSRRPTSTGTRFMFTRSGVMTEREAARRGVEGEIVFQVD